MKTQHEEFSVFQNHIKKDNQSSPFHHINNQIHYIYNSPQPIQQTQIIPIIQQTNKIHIIIQQQPFKLFSIPFSVNPLKMSDEQESNVNSEEEQEDDEQNEDEEDEDDEDEDDQDEDQDEESGDEDEDQDQDGSGEDGDDDKEDEEEESNQEEEQNKKLPTFHIPQRQPPTQFKFTSLLSQISNLSSSVDNFIGSLHSSSSSGFNRRPYSTNYALQQTTYQPRLSQIKVPQPPAQSRVVIMKDQDTQVDMKPQIIIQPTKPVQQDPVIQAKPYKISTESQKFLAQLYQENKRLKRWQANPTHPMNSYMTSYSGSNGFGVSGNAFYGSREKFERKEYEKGLFNVDERNKEIDEAIMMLKRQEEEDY